MKSLALILLAALAVFAVNRRKFSDSDSQRRMIWSSALRISAPNIPLGVGPDGFEDHFRRNRPEGFGVKEVAANAHNDLLQVLVTLGLVGLAAYVFLAWTAFSSVRGPELGAIISLFVSAKFSPIPLEAMILAAVLCGSVSVPKAMAPAGRIGLVCLSLAIAAFVVPISIADHYAHKGGLANLLLAIGKNPYELGYRSAFLRQAVQDFNQTQDPELRSVIVREMRSVVSSAPIYRPRAEVTNQILNFGREMETQIGGRL